MAFQLKDHSSQNFTDTNPQQNISTTMKRILTFVAAIFATSAAFAHDGHFDIDSVKNPSIDYLHVSAAVGFESQYMFRGEKRAGNSIQPQVEFVYPIAGFDLTAGAWNNAPLYGTKYDDLTELDLYADIAYKFDAFTVKAGYIYYWYTSGVAPQNYSNDMEVYIGGTIDTAAYFGENFLPSAFYFYNWETKQHTVEISVTYDTQLGEMLFGIPALTLPVGLYGGYASAGERNKAGQGVSYFYYGAQADIAYRITEYCTLSFGIRWSQRTGGEDIEFSWTGLNAPLGGRESNIWYGGKVSFGF